MSLIAELKRRNVFRAGAAYLALGWVIVQISGTVAPALHLPDWSLTLLIWLGAAGMPFVLLFAWVYELTPEGLKRESEIDRTASITHFTGRRLDTIIIALLVVAIALFALDRFVLRDRPAAGLAQATAPAAAPAAGSTAAKSIAVLPFTNMSEDKSNEYFGDGLAEELLNSLAKIPELRVAARTSSFHFKDKNPTIDEVAKALQVDTVLEGSVRRSGDTIRVVAQLISAADGKHLWSEKYDRPFSDIFKLQDDIADHIVRALLPHLGAESRALARTDASEISPELYERFLWARHRYYDRTQPAIAEARQELLTITHAAPDYAPAWAWLARATASTSQTAGGATPNDVAWKQAQEAIDTALRLDPNEAKAWFAQGQLQRQQRRDKEAEQAMDRALQLDPGFVDAHIARQRLMAFSGRTDQALAELETARRLDPLHPEVLYGMAHLLNLQGRKREAFATLGRLYEINPTNATELEVHLYSDSNTVARELFLADLVFRRGSQELDPTSMAWPFVGYGLSDHPAVSGTVFEPLALALAGKRDAASTALATMEKQAGNAFDARFSAVFTHIALGDEAGATEPLWRNWTAMTERKLGPNFGELDAIALIALLQKAGRDADAAPVVAVLEQEVAQTSPLHLANLLWFQAMVAQGKGDVTGALTKLNQLADAGYVGTRFLGNSEAFVWQLEKDPGLAPILARFDANRAAQLAEFERLRASGMDAAAARREYVATLP